MGFGPIYRESEKFSHPRNKKKAENTENQQIFLGLPQTEVTGQITTPKIGETDDRESQFTRTRNHQ